MVEEDLEAAGWGGGFGVPVFFLFFARKECGCKFGGGFAVGDLLNAAGDGFARYGFGRDGFCAVLTDTLLGGVSMTDIP